ncbi:hypothetical protein SLEP1_g30342 [Rubroshorea leprosula]|uniref:Uncharacterized protein n=1 Tax=Rubroshorea leprosula TaxID=152421 RepID=A0AAV5JZR1_9ROSI|nr:hypothetical protein SLEP1_g30342 [Rubroshorea leprosula]
MIDTARIRRITTGGMCTKETVSTTQNPQGVTHMGLAENQFCWKMFSRLLVSICTQKGY